MEEMLKNALDNDEKLLWSGRPEAFDTFDETNKKHFIKKVITAAVITALLVAGYALLVAGSGNFKLSIVVIILVFAVYSPMNLILDANKLKKKVLYGITDKRLITVIDSARSVHYTEIKTAALKTDPEGHTTLLCGHEAVDSKPELWRAYTIIGICMNDRGDVCERYAMYALPEPEKIREILKPYLDLA